MSEKKEQKALRNAIQQEHLLLQKVGKWVNRSFLCFLICMAVVFWGFSGMKDALLPDIPDSVRDVMKWAALVLGVISGVFALLSYVSLRNGKKHLLRQMDRLKK